MAGVAPSALGAGLSPSAASAHDLVIYWAERVRPTTSRSSSTSNEAKTGVEVLVETTPWADFQTKAFTELNAQGSAYDMIVGDSQWLGAASEGGHYVDLTDFFNENNLGEVLAPATVKYYAEYPENSAR